ncbi:hypothetical protein J2Z78_004399 [Streptomyces griseorubens]
MDAGHHPSPGGKGIVVFLAPHHPARPLAPHHPARSLAPHQARSLAPLPL